MDSRQITRLTRRSVRVRDTTPTLAVSRTVRSADSRAGGSAGRSACQPWCDGARPVTATAAWPIAVAAMVRWRSGTVAAVRRRWRGAVELDVTAGDGAPVRALAYPALVGEPEPGDRVLLNVGALAMGLGTGGYALVVALPDRLPAGPARRRRHPRRRAPGQGPLHPAAGDRAGRRRGGLAAPRGAGRRRRPGRHAGGHRRPALGAAGGAGRRARRRARTPGSRT